TESMDRFARVQNSDVKMPCSTGKTGHDIVPLQDATENIDVTQNASSCWRIALGFLSFRAGSWRRRCIRALCRQILARAGSACPCSCGIARFLRWAAAEDA